MKPNNYVGEPWDNSLVSGAKLRVGKKHGNAADSCKLCADRRQDLEEESSTGNSSNAVSEVFFSQAEVAAVWPELCNALMVLESERLIVAICHVPS